MVDYYEYIGSDEWKRKREEILKRDNYQCMACGGKCNLQVHHLTYKNIGNENEWELITLCKSCHQQYHEVKDRYIESVKQARKEYREKGQQLIIGIAKEYEDKVSTAVAQMAFDLVGTKKTGKIPSLLSWVKRMLTDDYIGCDQIYPAGGFDTYKIASIKLAQLRKKGG